MLLWNQFLILQKEIDLIYSFGMYFYDESNMDFNYYQLLYSDFAVRNFKVLAVLLEH